MKKLIAIVLAALTVLSFSTVAFAADTTTLTTTVPDATYTLNIPADQVIPFGATSTDIGNVTVTNSASFSEGKNLEVTLTYAPFEAAEISTTIPYKITMRNGDRSNALQSGDCMYFYGESDGTVAEKAYHKGNTAEQFECQNITVDILSTNWGKALGGEYSSTITFAAEVVSGS